MMNIKHNPQFNIEKVTAHYSKKDGVPIHYVCTSDLDKSDVPVDIYYRDSPHPDYNNYYFGLYTDEEDRMTDTGFIDGGRRYIRRGGADLDTQEYAVYKILDGEFIK